jgi:hypothetical protein
VEERAVRRSFGIARNGVAALSVELLNELVPRVKGALRLLVLV